jgi:hypothetical protein
MEMRPVDLQALAANRHVSYAEQLPGVSLEQITRLCELEYRYFTNGDEIVINGLNALLDELRRLVEIKGNDILVLVENAIRRVEKTGARADLEEILAIIRKSEQDLRRQVLAWLTHPQTVREHLEEEVRFGQAIACGEAALDALNG